MIFESEGEKRMVDVIEEEVEGVRVSRTCKGKWESEVKDGDKLSGQIIR